MKYVFLAVICAVVFLVCFLIDTLFKRIFPKTDLEKSRQVVRLPRRSAIFGVLLLFFPLLVVLFFMPEGGDTLIAIGCAVSAILGVILLVSYFSFAIWYDDETFLYKDFRHKKTLYHYSQIKGQRSLMPGGCEDAGCEGTAVKVGAYVKSRIKRYQEDLPVCERRGEKEEEKEGRGACRREEGQPSDHRQGRCRRSGLQP